jgi:hypothetical protein
MTNRVIPTVATIAMAVFALASCSKSTKATAAATVTVTTTVTESAAPTATTAVAAVSSEGSAPASLAAAPDPCALLTQSEANTLAGTKLQAGTEAGSGGVKTLCQYTGDPSGPTAQVEVIVGDGAKKALDIDRETLGHPFTTVSGIGDECDQEDGNIFVRKGNVWVDINLVLLNDPAQNVQPMQAAAKAVVAGLP